MPEPSLTDTIGQTFAACTKAAEYELKLRDGEYIIPAALVRELAKQVLIEIERQAARGGSVPFTFRR